MKSGIFLHSTLDLDPSQDVIIDVMILGENRVGFDG